MKFHQKIFLLLIVFLSLGIFGLAQTDTISVPKDSMQLVEPASVFELLQSNRVTEVILKTDLKKLRKSKKKINPEYQVADLSFKDINGKQWEWVVEVRVRGNMRKIHCFYPPIKLRFTSESLRQVDLDTTYNTLKLVCKCKKYKNSNDLLMREYLIYKMYNLLTEKSYRVNLLQFHFIDTKDKIKPEKQFVFILENTKEMIARINGREIEPSHLKMTEFREETTATMDIFQFMIGNTDYKILGLHNLKLVRIKGKRGIFPVPYDFDYSGLVNASYARPQQDVEVAHVKDRAFVGLCQPEANWIKAIQSFQEHREAMFSLVEENEHLSKRSKKYIKNYLQSFYKIIDKPKRVERWIKWNCRDK